MYMNVITIEGSHKSNVVVVTNSKNRHVLIDASTGEKSMSQLFRKLITGTPS